MKAVRKAAYKQQFQSETAEDASAEHGPNARGIPTNTNKHAELPPTSLTAPQPLGEPNTTD